MLKRTKTLKKTVLCAALCFLAVLMAPSLKGEAASKPTCAKTQVRYGMLAGTWDDCGYTIVLDQYKGKSTNYYQFLGITVNNLASNAKITNIKSSNTKVLTASYDKKKNKKGITVSFKGFGTSTVSFKVKQGGKTYKLSCKYTFKKTPMLATIKINGVNFTKLLNGRNGCSYKIGKSSVKVTYKKSSSLSWMEMYYVNKKGKKVAIKSGSTVTVPKDGLILSVCYKYKWGKYGGENESNYDGRTIYLTR